MPVGLFNKGDPFFHYRGNETNIIQKFKRNANTVLNLDERYLDTVLHCLFHSCTSRCLAKIKPLPAAFVYALSDHGNLCLPSELLNIHCKISANSLNKSSGHES